LTKDEIENKVSKNQGYGMSWFCASLPHMAMGLGVTYKVEVKQLVVDLTFWQFYQENGHVSSFKVGAPFLR
jgi:hypothetical protein